MNVLKATRIWLSKNQPAILFGTGVVGLVSTIFVSVRSYKKAKITIEKAQAEGKITEKYVNKKDRTKLTVPGYFKFTWKDYVLPATIGGLSITSLILSYNASNRKNIALAGALAASEAGMTEYQKHVIDTVGAETEQTIRNKMSEQNVTKAIEEKKTTAPTVFITGDSKVPCYEMSTFQKFMSTKEEINKVVNKLNHDRLNSCGDVTLNDLYYELGIHDTSLGNYLGWTVNEPIDISFSTIEVDGIPCLCIEPINMVPLK